MRHRSLLVPFLLALAVPVAACSSAAEEDTGASGDAVSAKNSVGRDFGLTDKEIALTLDDGPGPRTIELAQWLADENVPATFFMVGKNAKANPDAVKKLAELSASKGSLFFIGNHSMTHTTPLPKQGVDGATAEIMDADGILSDAINEAQSQLPDVRPFFRPPYGAFTALGASNIASINAAGAAKYSGPVFWDIGGELSNDYSADWACWGKVTMDRCIDGYVAETNARRRGIILAHDVHSKTVDMLTGKGSANGRSLIRELRGLGYTFVSLRAHDEAVASYAAKQETLSASNAASIAATIDTRDNGRVIASVKTAGAAKVVAQFDNATTRTTEFTGDKTIDVTLAPGSHFLTVSAFDAAGKKTAEQRYTFVLAAQLQNADTGIGSACVNYDHLERVQQRGQYFDFFHKKIDCADPNAQQAAEGECYRYKGKLNVARLPRSIGGDEWSVEYDLSYDADPNDKSKLSLILETGTGDIVTGKRTFTNGRAEVAIDEATDADGKRRVDCTNGIWWGKLGSEDFRFSKPPR
jgi:peptidoglycan/xylan/chitin deacetylase (PgdA/CDA1 family)